MSSSTNSVTTALPNNSLHRNTQTLDEAISACKQALSKNPHDAIAYNDLAEVLYVHGQLEKAIIACDRALKIDPNFALACKNRGSILQAQGHLDQARNWFEKAIQLDPQNDLFHQLLENLLVEQRYLEEVTINAHRQATTLSPDSSEAHYQLGKVLAQQGKVDEAIGCFRLAITLNSEVFQLYFDLGNLLLQKNHLPEAIACFQHAVRLSPEDAQAHHYLAEALVIQGQTEAAIDCYHRAIQLNPELYESHQRLGEALAIVNQLAAATASYRRAAELNPTSHVSYFYLADILERQGQLEEAILYYQKTLELNSENHIASYQLGRTLEKLGRVDEAIASYRQSTQLNPNFCWSNYALGEALAWQRDWHNAEEYYRRTIKLNPDFFGAYEKLGDVLSRRISHRFYPWVKDNLLQPGRLEEATFCYQKAIQLNPSNFWNYFQLGNVFSTQKKINEAIPYYQQACYQKLIKTKPDLANYSWQFGSSHKPDFFILGVGKAGTTSLYKYLVKHPQVLPALQKEVNFFSHYFDEGLPWYLAQFPCEIEGLKFLTGEATPCYLAFPEADQKLFSLFPDAKLILLLRNPVDRTISHYHDIVRAHYEERSLETAIFSELEILKDATEETLTDGSYFSKSWSYVLNSLYVYSIRRWTKLFPKENFLIIKSEDLYANPAKVVADTFNFLGLPNYQLNKYKNYYPGDYKSPVSESLRRTLADYFKPHNQMLEEYLGIEFNWN
ncbi:tetratricopeptide repeat protein [Cyanobacteria bacterium FACHB-471]|nr:tetratricopeptide repeat protein [Cyanobacteria bacterium FACHB-471]